MNANAFAIVPTGWLLRASHTTLTHWQFGGLSMEFVQNHPSVRMRDPNDVCKKVEKFTNDKPEHLLVIADFDHTLSRTKNHVGEECCISYGVFEMDALRRSPERANCFAKLTEKYLPIELSTTMTSEEKAPYMVEWWQKSNDYILETKYTEDDIEDLVAKSSIDLRWQKSNDYILETKYTEDDIEDLVAKSSIDLRWQKSNDYILETKYTEDDIEDLVAKSSIDLRDDVDLMIHDLDRHAVPLLIFSAGIGNIIDICLRKKMVNVPKNVHLVSNMMLFDAEGIACGFSEPLIHTFCKNGSMIEKCPSLRKEIAGRFNVLLLGDSLGGTSFLYINTSSTWCDITFEGIACGFSEPLIHTFCKNGSMIEKCPSLRKEIAGRFNVLLLGDSLGDLHMADGYRPNGDEITVLKIGFLNRAFDTHYEKFLDGFDIVLVDDQTMHLPRHLIQKITANDVICRE
uniref:5'-nucleotidase n=1 Tax=Ascaris lumbricoides TaxID=6252 RepID=A0A0M3IPZ0_ASCLU